MTLLVPYEPIGTDSPTHRGFNPGVRRNATTLPLEPQDVNGNLLQGQQTMALVPRPTSNHWEPGPRDDETPESLEHQDLGSLCNL